MKNWCRRLRKLWKHISVKQTPLTLPKPKILSNKSVNDRINFYKEQIHELEQSLIYKTKELEQLISKFENLQQEKDTLEQKLNNLIANLPSDISNLQIFPHNSLIYPSPLNMKSFSSRSYYTPSPQKPCGSLSPSSPPSHIE
jgi:hypothetical protein